MWPFKGRRIGGIITALAIAGAGTAAYRMFSNRHQIPVKVPTAIVRQVPREQRHELRKAIHKINRAAPGADSKRIIKGTRDAFEELAENQRTTGRTDTGNAQKWLFEENISVMSHVKSLIDEGDYAKVLAVLSELLEKAKTECPSAVPIIQRKLSEYEGKLKGAGEKQQAILSDFLKQQQSDMKEKGITLQDFINSNGDKQIEQVVKDVISGQSSTLECIGLEIKYRDAKGNTQFFYMALALIAQDGKTGLGFDLGTLQKISRLPGVKNHVEGLLKARARQMLQPVPGRTVAVR